MQPSNYRYIDAHSHPHDVKYEGRTDFLETLKSDGGATIATGTDYELSRQAIELSKKYDNIWATIGIHPADNHVEVFDENKFDELLELGAGKVVGIGECGLDYFYFDKRFLGEDRQEKINLEKERQREVFIKQVEYALKKDLPIVIHGRPSKGSMDAYEDILDVLENYEGVRGHAHFFVGDQKIAERFLSTGILLSFDGPITFTSEYDEVIKLAPLNMIMIETDSPYAAPVPYRGHTNYPHYVVEVAKKIATLKNETLEDVLEITKQNTIKLFNLK